MDTVLSIKKSVICAGCLALSVVLRQIMLFVPNADGWCAPLQLCVLICALFCGIGWGLLCGLCAPAFSWLICAQPSAALLALLMVECAVVALVGGLFSSRLKSAAKKDGLVAASLAALLSGRVLAGLMAGLFFGPGLSGLLFWCLSYAVMGLPSMVIALVLVSPLCSVLESV